MKCYKSSQHSKHRSIFASNGRLRYHTLTYPEFRGSVLSRFQQEEVPACRGRQCFSHYRKHKKEGLERVALRKLKSVLYASGGAIVKILSCLREYFDFQPLVKLPDDKTTRCTSGCTPEKKMTPAGLDVLQSIVSRAVNVVKVRATSTLPFPMSIADCPGLQHQVSLLLAYITDTRYIFNNAANLKLETNKQDCV